jgi:hypothetical protein
VATYNDWLVVKKSAAYRDALLNYIDDYGRWYHNGVARFAWGTFVRPSATNTCPISCLNDTKAEYINTWDGMSVGGLPQSTVVDKRSSWFADEAKARHNIALPFNPGSGADIAGIWPSPDHLTPFVQAYADHGVAYVQIFNTYTVYLSGTNVAATPAAPTTGNSSTGGTIDQAYVWVRVSGTKWSVEGTAGAVITETNDSTSSSEGPLSGSTNKVTVTLAACATPEEHFGWHIYAATSATASEPADNLFTRQFTGPQACGTTVDLTSVVDSKIALPASDNTNKKMQAFIGDIGETADTVLWEDVADILLAQGAAAFYPCDECHVGANGWNYRLAKKMREYAPGLLNLGIGNLSPHAQMYHRDIFDVPTNDPYGYQLALGADQRWTGTAERSATIYSCTDCCNATVSRTNSNGPVFIDTWTDHLASLNYGTRPAWTVLHQYNRTASWGCGYPYAEMRKQAWHAIIAQQNWGSIGGLMTWGWVSVAGMEHHTKVRDHSLALQAHFQLGAELMDIEDVLLAAPQDSNVLGTGTVLTSVATDYSAFPDANCAGYDEPYRYVTKQMDDGTQWIFATSLCSPSQALTFTLANEPAGAVVTTYPTGTKKTLAASAFSDTFGGFDVQVYRVSTPTGSRMVPGGTQ